MLLLQRNVGESIVITTPAGEKITVSLKNPKGKQQTIGIEASEGFRIIREELLQKC